MRKNRTWFSPALAGGLAGLANGFFGGGGGMVLVPMLTSRCGLSQAKAFATSVAVILPLCAVSAGIYLFQGKVDFMQALPYLFGGLAGGYLGGKLFKNRNMNRLQKVFALFVLYGGVKSLFF